MTASRPARIRGGPPAPHDDIPECPHCGARVALHQPDPSLPEVLLGVCAACRRWCLVVRDGGEVAPLDEVERFRPEG